jgi:Na+-driven multidrug efflux pump
MCFLDVIFNWFLIFPSHQVLGITIPGAGLGVMGAVIGTGLAFAVTSLLMCYFTTIASKELNLLQDKGSFIPKLDTLRKATKISLPIAVQHIIFCGAQITSTLIVAPLGTIAIAANSFGIIVEALCYMPGYGIGEAATTLIGQSIGADRKDLCRSFARLTLYTGMIVMAVMGVIMFIFAPEMMALMTPVEEIRTLGSQCLRIEAFAEPMFAASIIAVSVCVGAGYLETCYYLTV